MRLHGCKKDYIWNPNLSTCECNKKRETNKYLNNHTCIKCMVDNLVITCEGESLNKTKINASFSKTILFFSVCWFYS